MMFSRSRLRWLAVLLSLCITGLAHAGVKAEVDLVRVASGESLTLLLTHEGRTGEDPDLSPLNASFDVFGKSTSTNVQYVNGDFSMTTQVQVTLLPKQTGTLTIPPLDWDGERTQAIRITVSGDARGQQDATADRSVFMEMAVDPIAPYVQAATTLTVRLYTDQPLYQATLDIPANDAVVLQQLGQDQQSTATRNGHSYNVVQRQYLLFPQRSGALKLDGPVLDAQVADRRGRGNDLLSRLPLASMMNATKPLRLRGEPIELDVQPRPGGFGGDWLPAQSLKLESSWQPEPDQLHAGEPVTLRLDLRAVGLTAEQLPDLGNKLPLPPGIKAYPDQPTLSTETRDVRLIARRVQDIALIAAQAGDYTLPELRIPWWDTQADQARELVIPAQTFTVLPATGQPAVTPPAAPAPNPAQAPGSPTAAPVSQAADNIAPTEATAPPALRNPWLWSTLVLALLWIATLAWGLSRRQPSSAIPATTEPATQNTQASVNASRSAFQRACRAGDAHAARRHLLAWQKAEQPHAKPGLHALVQSCSDAEIAALLQTLDRACYTDTTVWDGNALATRLKQLPSAPAPLSHAGSGLPNLYAGS